jgi:hypothetical protein
MESGEISGSYGDEYEDVFFRDVAPCSLVDIDRRFGGIYCLHHEGDRQFYENPFIRSLSVKCGGTDRQTDGAILIGAPYGR